MNIALLLEMAAEGAGERMALGPRSAAVSYAELLRLARNSGDWLASQPGQRAALLDGNSAAVPLLLFGSALAGKAFAPVSYRLAAGQLRAVLTRLGPGTLVAAPDATLPAPLPDGLVVRTREQFLAAIADSKALPGTPSPDPDDIAVLLFTSGTTGAPKAAVLRQRQLAAYAIGTVEFLGAAPEEAALVSVPPYHIAGISAILSSVYAGRRVVQLEVFEPRAWVRLVNDERVTHAMVVPTMLTRIVDVLMADGTRVPSLRHLSYGGGRMPAKTIEAALRLLPHVDFVNGYGLTETSSTIAVLGPGDHRRFAAGDAAGRRRLSSVGRPLPSVEIEIRGPGGAPAGPGVSGEVFVRGEQVAGEYLPDPLAPTSRDGARLDDGGWFATRDAGYLDEEGYLFLDGRLDDIIVRGGENLSPGEIEDVLLEHPAVREAAVVGLPDPEWGEQVVAVVVPVADRAADAAALQRWVRDRLRSSRTPSRVDFVSALPYTETGKLLRRKIREQIIFHNERWRL
ncbi:MAG TPA: class I adenylate-forming enzyme family protein [Trebonia sp.]|nr:class I adenylate-forming enzyme family protein [Trebonia sp.]